LAADPSWVEADIPYPPVLEVGTVVDIEMAGTADTAVVHRIVVVAHTAVVRMPSDRAAAVEDIVLVAECSRYSQVVAPALAYQVDCHSLHRSGRPGHYDGRSWYNKRLQGELARAYSVHNCCRKHYLQVLLPDRQDNEELQVVLGWRWDSWFEDSMTSHNDYKTPFLDSRLHCNAGRCYSPGPPDWLLRE